MRALQRVLPALVVTLFVGAAVAGMRSGNAAAPGKPDLEVSSVAIGDAHRTAPKLGAIELSAADADEQLLGVCVFPWRIELASPGLLPGKVKVRNEVMLDKKGMFFDKPAPFAKARVMSGRVSITPGEHVLRVRLDTEHEITESDEGNNEIEIPVKLTGKCSTRQPTDDPGKRSKIAKAKQTPTQAIQAYVEKHYELHAVPKLKTSPKYRRASDIQFEVNQNGKKKTLAVKPWLRMEEIEYSLPWTARRPANDHMGWKLHVPSWTMRNDESLFMRWKWDPDVEGEPALSTLGGPDSGVLYINGVSYSTMVNYDSVEKTLTSFAHGVPLQPSDWPLEISIALRVGDEVYVSPRKTIERGTPYDYYDAALAPVFFHDRCKSCHSVGSKSAIQAYHGARAAPAPEGGPQDADSCMGCCHHQVIDRDWRSPRFDQGLDFSQMTTHQICNTVTSNLSPDEMWVHFRDDPRVHWALSSGRVPLGHEDKPVLFPGEDGVDDFLLILGHWVRHGTPCPP